MNEVLVPKKCSRCGRKIVFVRTARGKFMPCEMVTELFLEDNSGRQQFLTKNGKLVRGFRVQAGEKNSGFAYVPHFSNCLTPEERKRAAAFGVGKEKGIDRQKPNESPAERVSFGRGVTMKQTSSPACRKEVSAMCFDYVQECLFQSSDRPAWKDPG